MNRLRRRHAVVHHELQLPHVGAVRKDTHIAAKADVHTGIERGTEAGALLFHPRWLGLARFPAAIDGDGFGRRERGAVPHMMLRHQPEDLGRPVVAVFDGANAGECRTPHSFRRAGMHRHEPFGAARHLDRQLHLGFGERRFRFAVRAPAVVTVELDPVGTLADLVTDHPREPIHAIGFFRAEGHVTLRGATGPIGAGGNDGARACENAGTRDNALPDGITEADVRITGAFGAEIALRGDTGIERRARGDGGARNPERQRLVQHLPVPRRLVVGVKQKVGMAFDHAGHEREPAERDDLCTSGGDVPGRAHLRDGIALDQDGPAAMWLIGDAVVDGVRPEHDCRLGGERRSNGECRHHHDIRAKDPHADSSAGGPTERPIG